MEIVSDSTPEMLQLERERKGKRHSSDAWTHIHRERRRLTMRDGRRPTLSLERGTTTQGGLVTGGKIARPQIVKLIFSFFPT